MGSSGLNVLFFWGNPNLPTAHCCIKCAGAPLLAFEPEAEVENTAVLENCNPSEFCTCLLRVQLISVGWLRTKPVWETRI
jgi:hypothetical protein